MFILYVVAVLFFTYIGYHRISDIFFVLDEWVLIAGIKIQGPFYILNQHTWLDTLSGLHHPLALLIVNRLYYMFHYTTTPFIVVGLLLHVANSIFVYLLTKQLTKSGFIAFLSGLFFTSSFAYVQTLHWVATLIEIPGSTLFMLFSMLALIRYIDSRKIVWAIMSIFCAYMSFLLWDAFIFLFITLSVFLYIYERHRRRYSITFYIVTLLLSSLFVLLRLKSFQAAGGVEDLPVVMGVSGLFAGKAAYVQWLYKSALYPLVGLTQIFIPMRFIQRFIPFQSMLPILVAIAVCILATYFFFVRKIKAYRRPMMMNVVFYFFSFIPVALYFTSVGTPFIDERYLYFPTIFVGILFGMTVYSLLLVLRIKHVTLIMVLLLIYFYKQSIVTDSLMNSALYPQREMRTVTKQLLTYAEKVPSNPIFLITSNRDYYFYANNKLPFEQGTGFILMTIFWETGRIPRPLLANHFLQSISSAGYASTDDDGFGYFYDKNQLVKLYKDNPKLSVNQIISFYYDDVLQQLKPTTEDIRLYVATMSGRTYATMSQ